MDSVSFDDSKDLNKNKILQRLLHKTIMWRFSRNLQSELQERNISHAEVSRMAGRVEGALNKTINRVEDIRMSSFIRYWVSISEIQAERYNDQTTFHEIEFSDLVDDQIRKMAVVASDLSREEFDTLVRIESKFLISISEYVEAMQNIPGALSPEEIAVFDFIVTKCGRTIAY